MGVISEESDRAWERYEDDPDQWDWPPTDAWREWLGEPADPDDENWPF